jgi:hypothetical protein
MFLKVILITLVTFIGSEINAKENSFNKRAPTSAETCEAPLKNFRTFIVIGLVNEEDDSAELVSLSGAKSESINCISNIFSTIDVSSDGIGKRMNFYFKNTKNCKNVLTTLKKSSKENPNVIVIDKACTPHLSE